MAPFNSEEQNKNIPEEEVKVDDTADSSIDVSLDFTSDIEELLTRMDPEGKFPDHAVGMLNDFVKDLTDRISAEAVRLTKEGKEEVVTREQVRDAMKLVLPADLTIKKTDDAGIEPVTENKISKA